MSRNMSSAIDVLRSRELYNCLCEIQPATLQTSAQLLLHNYGLPDQSLNSEFSNQNTLISNIIQALETASMKLNSGSFCKLFEELVDVKNQNSMRKQLIISELAHVDPESKGLPEIATSHSISADTPITQSNRALEQTPSDFSHQNGQAFHQTYNYFTPKTVEHQETIQQKENTSINLDQDSDLLQDPSYVELKKRLSELNQMCDSLPKASDFAGATPVAVPSDKSSKRVSFNPQVEVFENDLHPEYFIYVDEHGFEETEYDDDYAFEMNTYQTKKRSKLKHVKKKFRRALGRAIALNKFKSTPRRANAQEQDIIEKNQDNNEDNDAQFVEGAQKEDTVELMLHDVMQQGDAPKRSRLARHESSAEVDEPSIENEASIKVQLAEQESDNSDESESATPIKQSLSAKAASVKTGVGKVLSRITSKSSNLGQDLEKDEPTSDSWESFTYSSDDVSGNAGDHEMIKDISEGVQQEYSHPKMSATDEETVKTEVFSFEEKHSSERNFGSEKRRGGPTVERNGGCGSCIIV